MSLMHRLSLVCGPTASAMLHKSYEHEHVGTLKAILPTLFGTIYSIRFGASVSARDVQLDASP